MTKVIQNAIAALKVPRWLPLVLLLGLVATTLL